MSSGTPPELVTQHAALRDAALRWPVLGTALACWLGTLCLWAWAPARSIDRELYAQLTPFGRGELHPDYDIPIYLIAGAVSVAAATLAAYLCTQVARKTPLASLVPTGLRPLLLDLVVPLAIFGIVWTPAPATLAGQIYRHDGFFHINFYVMAPLQAYRHGAALGTSAYSQYGCGWILVFDLLGKAFPIDYPLVFGAFTLFGSCYFIAVYAVLRCVLRDAFWAMAGVLCCVFLQLYCGLEGPPKWGFPSSTVARCPLDMVLTLALLQFGRTRGIRYAVLAGLLAGLAILFGIDTGIYVLAGILTVSALLLFEFFRRREARVLWTLGWLWGAAAAAALAGLFVASRGTVFQLAFWTGYLEVLHHYPTGFSALPVSKALGDPVVAILLLCVVMIYTLTLAGVFARALHNRAEPDDLAFALVAVVGFGTLTLFINRSHPLNLYHLVVPACVLGAVLLRRAALSLPFLQDKLPARVRRFGPVLVSGGVVAALLLSGNFWKYPSAVVTWTRPQADHQFYRDFLAQKIRAIQDVGQELKKDLPDSTFALTGADPTLWLVTLNLPVSGRYCPPIPLTRSHETKILADFAAERVVIERDRASLATGYLEYRMPSRYQLVRETEEYSLWQRSPGLHPEQQ